MKVVFLCLLLLSLFAVASSDREQGTLATELDTVDPYRGKTVKGVIKQLKNQRKALQKSQTSLESIQRRLSAAKQYANDIQKDDIPASEENIDIMRTSLDIRQEEKAAAMQRVEAVKASNGNSANARQARIAELQAEINRLETIRKPMWAKVMNGDDKDEPDLFSRCQQIENTQNKLRSDKEQLESGGQLSAESSASRLAEEKVNELDTFIADLNTELTSSQEQLEAQRSRLQDKLQEVAQLEASILSSNDEIKKKQEAVDEVESFVKTAKPDRNGRFAIAKVNTHNRRYKGSGEALLKDPMEILEDWDR
jgi:chromosome segregation ATPase